MKLKRLMTVTASALLALNLAACSSNNDDDDDLALPLPNNAQAYLLIKTGSGAFQIQRISNNNSNSASVAAPAQNVTNLPTGEDLVGMDFRSSNGALYLLGRNGGASNSLGAVYRVDNVPDSGNIAVTLVGELTANPNDTSNPESPFAGLEDGTSYGVDFNPVPDALRVVGSNGENLRIPFVGAAAGDVPGTAVITDGNLSTDVSGTPIATGITAAAYTNADNDTATATELFVLRAASGEMFKQDPPNNGTLTLRGLITEDGDTLTAGAGLGFDILTVGTTNTAFLAGQDTGSPNEAGIGTLNLETRVFTVLFSSDSFPSSSRIVGLAVRETPSAEAVALR
jgi:hypothetical protein